MNPILEMLIKISERNRELDSYVQPWQRAIKEGDKIVQVTDHPTGGLMTVYAEVLPTPEDRDPKSNNLVVRAYSNLCPEGEVGLIHRALFAAQVSNIEWDIFKFLGWPDISHLAKEVKNPKAELKDYDGKLPGN
jgi:hypothetical protein